MMRYIMFSCPPEFVIALVAAAPGWAAAARTPEPAAVSRR